MTRAILLYFRDVDRVSSVPSCDLKAPTIHSVDSTERRLVHVSDRSLALRGVTKEELEALRVKYCSIGREVVVAVRRSGVLHDERRRLYISDKAAARQMGVRPRQFRRLISRARDRVRSNLASLATDEVEELAA